MLSAQIKENHYSNADIKITTDLSKVDDAVKTIEARIKKEGVTRVDALINNAAVQIKKKFMNSHMMTGLRVLM